MGRGGGRAMIVGERRAVLVSRLNRWLAGGKVSRGADRGSVGVVGGVCIAVTVDGRRVVTLNVVHPAEIKGVCGGVGVVAGRL